MNILYTILIIWLILFGYFAVKALSEINEKMKQILEHLKNMGDIAKNTQSIADSAHEIGNEISYSLPANIWDEKDEHAKKKYREFAGERSKID
jgi:hypothetical protein